MIKLLKLLGAVVLGTAAVMWFQIKSGEVFNSGPSAPHPTVEAGYSVPDIRVLSEAHRALLAAMKRQEAITGKAQANMNKAATRRDRLGMYQALREMRDAATDAHDAIAQASSQAPANEQCKDALIDALTLLAQAYAQKAQGIETAMSAVDTNGLLPSQADDLQQRDTLFGGLILQGTAKLLQAYETLGYKPDAVDTEHGGLLDAR